MTPRLFPRPRLALPCAGLMMLAACTDQGSLTDAPTGAAGAPLVRFASSATLVPGQTVTLTGENFHPVADSNAVHVGGVRATVTGGGASALSVVVPCVPSGPAAVQVDRGGVAGVPLAHHVQAPRRKLAVGESLVLSGAGEAECNELAPSGGDARYVLAVYNTSRDPWSTAGFKLSAPGGSPEVPATPSAASAPAPAASAALSQDQDDPHLRIMEMNRRAYARLRARAGDGAQMRARTSTAPSAGPPPLTRTIRVADVYSGGCDRFYTVNATRVYYDGKIALYEDDASPAWVKAAANPRMQAYYNAIGDDFNTTSEPIVRRNFGDPLLRDAQTDANGVVVALFTPLLNTTFGGVPAYIVSCDLFPNGEGNASGNNGEFLYAFQPTVNGTGWTS
ncbi:MAG TPA: IPT/TIG domain-containing protein, partial [Longimicrobium sp.]|nr:IPT/TIG domain-containing protein [Longimicrobium sp.]